MECGSCHQPRKDLFCARCLTQGLKKHTEANQILTTQLKASRTRSERILNGAPSSSRSLDADRVLSARISQLTAQNGMLAEEVQRQQEACKKKGQALRARKEIVSQRRKALAAVSASHVQERDLVAEIADTRRATLLVGQRLRHARRVLVLEAIDIFGIKRTRREDGRGKGKTIADNWEIVGLIMPPPERFTEFSSAHLNAVFEHLIHLLVTIAGYLDLAVPFTPQWQGASSTVDNAAYDSGSHGSKPGDASTTLMSQSRIQTTSRSATRHIGRIHLSASTNIPFIRFAQDTAPLSTSETAVPPSLQKRALLYVSSSREKWKRRQRKHPDQAPPPSSEPTAARATRDKHREKEDHLNLSYTMLLLDVMYIAQTQGVAWLKEALDATRVNDGSAAGLMVSPLRLIDDLRWSEGLGSASHGPSPNGSLVSIVLPFDLAQLHTAVLTAFAEDPPTLKRGTDEAHSVLDNAEDKAIESVDIDDWDFV